MEELSLALRIATGDVVTGVLWDVYQPGDSLPRQPQSTGSGLFQAVEHVPAFGLEVAQHAVGILVQEDHQVVVRSV